MWVYIQTIVLAIGAALCLAEAFLAPPNSHPGRWLMAGMGLLLLRRAFMSSPQGIPVISGCFLAAVMVLENRGLANFNGFVWIALTVVAFVCFAFWERIEKLWKKGGYPPT